MKRALALLPLSPLLLLIAGCHDRSAEPLTEAMDNNMAAKADEMEATANNRAEQMAGDMMTNAAEPGDNASAADNAMTNGAVP